MKNEDEAHRFKLMLGNLKIVLLFVGGCVALWEFWPFNISSEQTLSFSSDVVMENAVLRSINVVEFEINSDQQRVIQRVVSPLRDKNGASVTLCSFAGRLCKDRHPAPPLIRSAQSESSTFKMRSVFDLGENASPIVEKPKFSTFWKNLPGEDEVLTELQNCTIKSPDDWICKSNWYKGQGKESNDNYIGKSDGKWIANPLLSGLINWKSVLWFEKLRCGDLCYVTTKQKYGEIQAKRMQDMREVFGSEN